MKKIIIVTKNSKYEYEQQKFGLSHDELLAKYNGEHANLQAILSSHERQLVSRERLKELFPQATLMSMHDLTTPIKCYDLVISFGGDNSFTYTSHFVGNAQLMGVNADPGRSVGALCPWTDLEMIADHLEHGAYSTEQWPRLQATIGNIALASATSEYFFGERLRKDMSRYVLVYRGREYEQKSSGIIIATGAGSTGWYDSAGRYFYPNGNQFAKTTQKAAFIIAEPYRYRRKPMPFAGDVLPGEELIIHSLHDAEGYASSDSWEEYAFSRGKTAVIRLSHHPLQVIVPRGEF
ncbi:hypothetical protein HY639_00560 [Candidatus Woesearchaeota archaeon]|nr:hypothetical protein [Candidatus Woesearchaeota archaeon]